MRICAGIFADVIQIGDAMDVDQILRPGDAELHHRHQTLAAGQELRIIAVLPQKLAIASPMPFGAEIFKSLLDTCFDVTSWLYS